MLCPEAEAARGGRAQHDRHGDLAGREVTHLRGLGDDLIERDPEELREHDLHNGPQPLRRGADGGADDRGLGDRRVAHAVRPELLE